jgi:hypothetical protein
MHKPGGFLWAGALTLMVTQALSAQSHATDRGSIAVAGSASFASNKSPGTSERVTVLDLRPAVQYFFAPGVAVGGQLTLGRSSSDGGSATLLGIGPLISYYFGQLSPRVQPFVSAEVSVVRSAIDSPLGDDEATNTGLMGAAGLLLLLSNSVGVNGQLYYRHVNLSSDFADLDGNSYGLAFGIAAFVF